jgi:hypothetical protein
LTVGRLGLLAVLAAALAAAVVLPAGGAVGKECAGVPKCISVPGPWVVVPAHGTATYLLECPKRHGVVGGLDARLTTQDIRVSWDGLVASPVSPGRTTTAYAFFRAVSALHQRGAFEPRIGCIPSNNARDNTSALVVPLGTPLDLVAKTLVLRPGTVQTTTLGCPHSERLVDSWDATAFRTDAPPAPALADAIRVQRTTREELVEITVSTGASLPPGAQAQVQLGLECAGR